MFTLDASKKNGQRLVGDVDFEGARRVAGWITPVPGGGCLICYLFEINLFIYLWKQNSRLSVLIADIELDMLYVLCATVTSGCGCWRG